MSNRSAEDTMHLFSDNTALRPHVESQVNFTHAFYQQAVDRLRLVSAMNLKLARQEIEGTLDASRDIMACSDPMQMAQAAMRQIPQAAVRLRTYQQYLLSLLAALSAPSGDQVSPGGATKERSPAASEVAGEVLQHAAGAGNGSASAAGETHH